MLNEPSKQGRKMKTINFLRIILRGIGQVMLQNNAITGLLFLIGIFYNSWIMGSGAIIGVITSTITAVILKYDKKDIHNGLYGFNGTLVGIALPFFFDASALLIGLIILGSILSSLVMNFMHEKKILPYTFPFIISTWALIILIKSFDLIPQQTQELVKVTNLQIISSLTMGFGQVMFQASIITGIIFFVAVLINSRLSAIYGLTGSILGALIGFLISAPLNLLNIGIFGFNGVLCGIAFADTKKYSYLFALVSIVISVLIIYGFLTFNLIALTAPFVFATWITLFLRKRILKRNFSKSF